jgi:hypothetical protein
MPTSKQAKARRVLTRLPKAMLTIVKGRMTRITLGTQLGGSRPA